MCGACGGAQRDWYAAGVLDSATGRMRAARELAAAANDCFGPHGLHAQCAPASRSVSVRNASGGTRHAATAASVVVAARELIAARARWHPFTTSTCQDPAQCTCATAHPTISRRLPPQVPWPRATLWIAVVLAAYPRQIRALSGVFESPNGLVHLQAGGGQSISTIAAPTPQPAHVCIALDPAATTCVAEAIDTAITVLGNVRSPALPTTTTRKRVHESA